MAHSPADIEEARLHAMLDNPHHAHAIAALTDDELAELAADGQAEEDEFAAPPDDDHDDTDLYDDPDFEKEKKK